MERQESIRAGNAAIWTALGFALFAIAFGPVVLFPRQLHEVHLRTGTQLLLAAIVLSGFFLPIARIPLRNALGIGAFLLVCFYAVSDLSYRPYGYPQARIGVFEVAVACSIAAAISALFKERYLILLALATLGAGGAGFLDQLGGAPIFSDDHPSFLFRLLQLRENFPAIPFYNPLWNAGVEAREFFASGVLNVFFLFSPIIYGMDVTEAYSIIVALVVFAVSPGASYLAGRVVGMSRPKSALAACLHATASLSIYRWSLSYGTLGFALSSGLAPLSLALLGRFIDDQRPASRFLVPVTALCLTLCFLWSPSILLLCPAIAWTVLRARGGRARMLFVALALTGALNLPWVAVFVKVSNVGAFVAGPKADGIHDSSKFKIREGDSEIPVAMSLRKRIHDNAVPASPFVLFFGLAGLAVLVEGRAREILLAGCGAALALGIAGPILKPQLELERMLVVFIILLAVPASDLLADMLSLERPLTKRGAPALLLLGFLSFSPLWLWRVATNRTNEHFQPAPPELSGMVETIKRHAGDGRTLFAGFTLHELGGGHVAPLAAWTGKPLIASSYQHDKWRYTEVIPAEFMKRGFSGIMEYMDLMNVSLVAAHDRTWRRWLTRRKAFFKPIWRGGRFTIFERIGESARGFFLAGGGEILEMNGNGVLLRIDTADAVLKFRYLPFLEFPGCRIAPRQVSASITFVALEDCAPGTTGRLAARGIVSRLTALPPL